MWSLKAIHYEKVTFRDEFHPRPWTKVTIWHVFWASVGDPKTFFFFFEALYSHGLA
jgi:hypothetical protein